MERIALRRWSLNLQRRIGTPTHIRNTPRTLPTARPLPSQTTFRSTSSIRPYSSPAAQAQAPLEPPADLDAKERAVFEQLVAGLQPAELVVRDVSGGCGSMYAIEVASERFRGLGVLAQQRMVNKVLEGEIGGWHGVQVKTRVP
jgi:stress-induced morphogen